MGIVSWIVLGLIAGCLAKLIMPGKDPGGIIITILIGIAGAVVGGYISTAMGIGTAAGYGIKSIAIAVGGAVILLVAYRLITKRH